jgi:hypothetical protein
MSSSMLAFVGRVHSVLVLFVESRDSVGLANIIYPR